jgi:hypothetical protein
MTAAPARERISGPPRTLPYPPDELTRGRLRRLGEGIGKVVYASEHWVVRRERSPGEVVALILLWKALRKMERVLPRNLSVRLLAKPSRQIRFLRLCVQAAMAVLPKSIWFTTHIREVWMMYHRSAVRGERIAEAHLAGSALLPSRVTFPRSRLKILGWPGWLMASEAAERVDATLHRKLTLLARAGRFDEVEDWLRRFLELRTEGWKRGVFSLDAHLKNFGVCGERLLLLDTGGLTNRWPDVENRLALEETIEEPHLRLGLGQILAERPEIAERFNARWKATVNRAVVGSYWPSEPEEV